MALNSEGALTEVAGQQRPGDARLGSAGKNGPIGSSSSESVVVLIPELNVELCLGST